MDNSGGNDSPYGGTKALNPYLPPYTTVYSRKIKTLNLKSKIVVFINGTGTQLASWVSGVHQGQHSEEPST